MDISLKVPTDLNDITVGQYQKFLKIQDNNEDASFINQKMIEIFCEIPLSQVMRIKVKDMSMIIETMNKILDVKEPEFVNRFFLDNIEYGFIPNLDEITFGEFVDLEETLQDWDQMHLCMNVLFRPIDISHKDRYSIKEYKGGDSEDLKGMPLGIALGAVFFLLNLGKEVRQVIVDYLEKDKLDPQSLVKEALHKNGQTTKVFTASLKEMLQNLNISLK